MAVSRRGYGRSMHHTRVGRPAPPAPSAVFRWSIYGLVIFLSFMLALHALAHDGARWIQRGGYKNAVGELCCGERDCAELSSSDIKITAAGYLIKSIRETVPYNETLPSPNGRYWRCYWGGRRKCFFAPPSTN